MSVNKFRPHILVIPEDDANRQIANGFILTLNACEIHVEPEVGGWVKVREAFESDYLPTLRAYATRHVVLLVDFDGQDDRLVDMKLAVPEELQSRVFVFGAWLEPEDLKKAGLGNYEKIGRTLAEDCREETSGLWTHVLLRHNAAEISRFNEHARRILFGD